APPTQPTRPLAACHVTHDPRKHHQRPNHAAGQNRDTPTSGNGAPPTAATTHDAHSAPRLNDALTARTREGRPGWGIAPKATRRRRPPEQGDDDAPPEQGDDGAPPTATSQRQPPPADQRRDSAHPRPPRNPDHDHRQTAVHPHWHVTTTTAASGPTTRRRRTPDRHAPPITTAANKPTTRRRRAPDRHAPPAATSPQRPPAAHAPAAHRPLQRAGGQL
ncbi:hypothetical protein DXG01_014068, partial [Tephrocybe rancida]